MESRKNQTERCIKFSLFWSGQVKRLEMFLKIFIALTIATAIFARPQNGIEDVAFINVGSFSKQLVNLISYPEIFNQFIYSRCWWWSLEIFSFEVLQNRMAARSVNLPKLMELMTLESEVKQTHLLNSLEQHSAAFGTYEWINIGAMTTTCGSRDLWYWLDTGSKVNFPIQFGVPNPNCAGDNEMCLALGKYESGKFYVADTWCTEHPSRFLCKQKDIVFSGWASLTFKKFLNSISNILRTELFIDTYVRFFGNK